jgi:hypothetical protein
MHFLGHRPQDRLRDPQIPTVWPDGHHQVIADGNLDHVDSAGDVFTEGSANLGFAHGAS